MPSSVTHRVTMPSSTGHCMRSNTERHCKTVPYIDRPRAMPCTSTERHCNDAGLQKALHEDVRHRDGLRVAQRRETPQSCPAQRGTATMLSSKA